MNNCLQLGEDEQKCIQIKILKEVANYCYNNKIRYYLGYGTLLGAVRHKGYIPWDDDIDIVMPRPDYKKFIHNFNKNHENFHVYDVENNPDYPWPYAKVSYNKTISIETTDLVFNQLGVNIDVFPIDGLPDDKNKQEKLVKEIKWYLNLLNIKSISLNANRKFYKNAILVIGKFLLLFINYRKIIEKIINKAKYFKYDGSKYVACLVWGYGEKEILPKKVFESQVKMKFENIEFYVPVGYHEYLTHLYGDYMQLPPEGKRVTHHSCKTYYK